MGGTDLEIPIQVDQDDFDPGINMYDPQTRIGGFTNPDHFDLIWSFEILGPGASLDLGITQSYC